MARYFFDVRDGRELVDRTGVELADLEAARVAAAHLAGRLLGDHAERFWRDGEWRIDVKDRAGLILTSLIVAAHDAAALTKS